MGQLEEVSIEMDTPRKATILALTPDIGYDRAVALSKKAYKTVREDTDLSEEDLDRLLDTRKMTDR